MNSRIHKTLPGLASRFGWTLALCSLAAVAAAADAPARRSAAGRPALPRLVVTQLPLGTAAERAGPGSSGPLSADYGEGARLVLVEGGRLVKVLTPGFHSAADPDVSYDGGSIVFAGRKSAGDRWAIYEMKADGSGVRQVLAQADDLRQPLHLPTILTLAADPSKGTDAWEQIGFVRVSATEVDELGTAPLTSLGAFRPGKPDGEVVRLSHALSRASDPALLPDGRLVYASLQRSSLDRGFAGRVALLAMNTDGTDPAVFAADEGRRVKQMPCATTDRLVVFVEGDGSAWDGAGSLACVTLRRNLHSYRRITLERDGLFHSPSPLPDGKILAAMRPADGSGSAAIARVDPLSGKLERVFDDPSYHDVQARLLAPRALPDRRSTPTRDDAGDGILYGLDVYLNDLPADALPPGAVKRLRVIEGLADTRAGGAQAHGLTGYAPRRLLGEAPIEEDGSFQVLVPANVPVQLQILDADGLALRTSGWIWARHRAGAQGCVGCHEDGELAPSNRFVDAVAKPAVKLNLPPEKRASVDFKHDIAPLVAERCLACHGEGQQVRLDGAALAGATSSFSRAYQTLLAGLAPRADGAVAGAYVRPGHARASPLIWHLFGRNTSRAWDGAEAAAAVKKMPNDSGLTDEERRLFVEWIDLGALWDVGAAAAGQPAGGAKHEANHPH